ncbi:hypothetical protein ONS96_002235 [Cadophora gregata f. sp. sojae]|nr:hypothetical protein ONS96_002235 [Cadophora gregata f. sp. sojae]
MESITSGSEIIHIEGLKYLKGEIIGTVAPTSSICRKDSTVIELTDVTSFDPAIIRDISKTRLKHFFCKDDVFHNSFAQHLLLKTSPDAEHSWKRVQTDLETLNFQSDLPREGPYLLIGTALHRVFKLYPDTYNAFMYGILQSGHPPSFKKSPVGGYIPVASRLYYEQCADRPLAGKHIAIKDIYDIQGLVTGASSQAYAKSGNPAGTTAPCIQTLLDLGAVIIGKVKTVQFASGMSAGDWTETVCPTNPRGDQYLDPNCSSSGSAVSVAGYEWLDYAIGSDSEEATSPPGSSD